MVLFQTNGTSGFAGGTYETSAYSVFERGSHRVFNRASLRASNARHRRRRHRRRGARQQWTTGSGRVGDRGNDGPSDEIRAHGRDRRFRALRPPRPAGRELSDLGARIRACRFAEDAGKARSESEHDIGCRTHRSSRRALLPRELLVHADEDSGAGPIRREREERHSREPHTDRLAEADEEYRLHRLSSVGPGGDAHDPGATWFFPHGTRSLDAARAIRPSRRVHGRPARGRFWRSTVRLFGRLDGSHRQRRTPEIEACTSRRDRAQHRRDIMGMGRTQQISARFDLVR
jgi:hypothetical protein